MPKSNKVLKSQARFFKNISHHFSADPFADIIANLMVSSCFCQLLIYFSRTEKIFNCLDSILQITKPRIRMKFYSEFDYFSC